MKPIYKIPVLDYILGAIGIACLRLVIAVIEVAAEVRRWFGKGDLV